MTSPTALANQLLAETINLAEFQSGMMSFISDAFAAAAIAAAGGVEFMTQADWGFEGILVRKQYDYIRGFVNDIADGDQAMNGTLVSRAGLYEQAVRGAYEEMLRRYASFWGNDEEIRILGGEDHCAGCLEQAAREWQPIGTLDPIGAEECSTNCRCEFQFRNSARFLG